MKTSSFLLITCTALALVCGCTEQKKKKSEVRVTKVRVSALTQRHFSDVIRIQGCIKPEQSADISARKAGVIELLEVKEGSQVKKGQVLFQTDFENLKNQQNAAERTVEVAKEAVKVAKTDIELAEIALEQAKRNFDREKALHDRNISTDKEFESYDTAWKNARTSLDKAKLNLEYRTLEVSQYESLLAITQKNLQDATIVAPYDGVITAKVRDQGEFVGAGTKVLHIEDQNHLEFSAHISSIYYSQISKSTKVSLAFRGKTVCETTLSFISPHIEPLTRTFEIKAQIPPNTPIPSGALCDATIILDERDGEGLPENALLTRAKGYAVFVVESGNTAREIPLTTGITADGFTEITNPENLKDRQIVIQGHYLLNDGAPVSVESDNP